LQTYDEKDTQSQDEHFGPQIVLWELELTDMYAATIENPNPVGLCISPCEGPVKQPDTAEAELVRLLQAGNEATFQEFIDRYGPRIYRLAFGILRNRDDAEDVAQEVFAKVYFSINGFQARSSLYSWVSRIAINECYTYLRKKRPIYESDSPDGTLSTIMQSIADPQPRADLVAMQRDFINKLLTQVSEDERVLLVWKEVEGLSLEELCEMTGLNENIIKVRLFRARQRLARAAAKSRDRWLLARGLAAAAPLRMTEIGKPLVRPVRLEEV
jgi:RNA polymerase sigma-70 factor (ECF subfamily)